MEPMKTRFLCVCEGGVVRSAALATVLRWDFGQESVALSAAKNGHEIFDMLSAWADYIILMQPAFETSIPKKYASKIRVFDVGPDVWGNPMHKDLRKIVGEKAQEWYTAGWIL